MPCQCPDCEHVVEPVMVECEVKCPDCGHVWWTEVGCK